MFDDDKHMGEIAYECLKSRPDSICQIDAATSEQETKGSVLRRSVQIARCFRQLGLVPGDVLALSGKNHLDQEIPYFAALMNGMPITGIDHTFKFGEIKAIFKVTEPKVAFCEPESYEDYTRAASDLGLDTKVYTFGKGAHSMQQLAENYKDDSPVEEFQVAKFDKDKIYAWLISTGGTTGVLKVAAIKHDAWKKMMTGLLTAAFGARAHERKDHPPRSALNLSSIQWVSGIFNVVGMPVLNETKIQTSAPPTVDHVIEIINKYKPVSALLSPSLATGILKSEKPCDLTSFQSLVLTGGKVYKDLVVGLRARAGERTMIFEAYGQSENLGPVLRPDPRAPIGSCGKSYPSVQLKLVDPETGKEITEPNVSGELYTKGSCRFSCYYNNPEETAKAFTEDGWFKTGDLLYRDEDDNYYFVERLKMLIKYRNYHIAPPEIEEVIRSLPQVQEVSVTSVPHDEDGEHPVACVVRRKGATVTAQEIKDVVAKNLSEAKHLRGGVVFLDAIPLTHAGKVARATIRKLVMEMHRE